MKCLPVYGVHKYLHSSGMRFMKFTNSSSIDEISPLPRRPQAFFPSSKVWSVGRKIFSKFNVPQIFSIETLLIYYVKVKINLLHLKLCKH